MMSDPDRLLDETAGDPAAALERKLLRSIADVSPPAGAERVAWDGIAARIGAATALAAGAGALARSSAAAPSAVTGAAHATASKVLLATVITAGAAVGVGGTWLIFAHHATSTPVTVSTPAAARPVHAAAAQPVNAAAPALESAAPNDAPAANTDEPSTKAPQRLRPDQALAMESAALTDARAALRKGDPRGALAVLRRLDVRLPRGVLGQEREVLAIEALSAMGDRATARRRATTFVNAFPNSPHTPLLRHLAEGP